MTDWPVKTLGEVCEVLDNLRKPITKRDRTSGDYPYYGATGIVDHVGDYIFDERLVLVGEDGAKWGAGERTAFIAEGKYWVNNHAHVLRCKRGALVDSWLANFLTMSDLNRYVSGLTVPKLNQGSLVSIEIPVPPLEEQKRIVALLDAATAHVTELTACYEQARTHANNLFTSALRDALESNPDWPVKTLGEICIGTDRQDPAVSGQSEFTYIDLSAVNQMTKQIDDFRTLPVNEAPGRARQLVKSGDVLVSTVRPNLNAVALVGSELNGSTASTGFCVLRPNRSIVEPGLLFAWARNQLFIDELTSQAKGASYPAVTDNVVKALEIPVPPLEEQKKIVARLDSMRAKTSEMVAAYDANLQAAKNLRQSILESAFEGKL